MDFKYRCFSLSGNPWLRNPYLSPSRGNLPLLLPNSQIHPHHGSDPVNYIIYIYIYVYIYGSQGFLNPHPLVPSYINCMWPGPPSAPSQTQGGSVEGFFIDSVYINDGY